MKSKEEERIEKLREAVAEAQWLIDHIFDNKKRVDWGKTFDINWGRMNTAMICISQALKEDDKKKE